LPAAEAKKQLGLISSGAKAPATKAKISDKPGNKDATKDVPMAPPWRTPRPESTWCVTSLPAHHAVSPAVSRG
jgi:hypothetical protein